MFKEFSFAKNCLKPRSVPLRLIYYNFQKNRIHRANFVDVETIKVWLY